MIGDHRIKHMSDGDKALYLEGYLDCLFDYAVWSSGEMYVGCGVKTYKQVKKEVEDKMHQFDPDPKLKDKFIVRLYDGFDNQWMDISKPVSKEEADKIWNEKTENGTKNKSYSDIDYYKIFHADTKMVFSDGFGATYGGHE